MLYDVNNGIPEICKKIRFSFVLARTMGIFPFSWTIETERNLTKFDENPYSISLKKSFGGNLWSLLLLIGGFLLMIADILNSINEPRGKIVGTKTVEVAQLINDVVTAIATFILQTIYWSQRNTIAECIMQFSKKNLPMPSWTIDTFILFVFIMLICAPFNCVMYTCYVFKSYSVISKVLMSVKMTVYLCLTLCVAITYRCSLILVTKNLDEVFDRYIATLDENNHGTDDDDNDSVISVVKKCDCIPNRIDSSLGSIDLQPRLSSATASRNTIFMTTKQAVVHWQDLHSAINNYMEYPVTVVIFCLIIWLLVVSFYLLMWTFLTLEGQVLAVLHFVETIIPLFFILNSTHSLSRKVGIL